VRKFQSNQTVFNRVARHLLKQNEKAVCDNGYCMYLGNNRLKCAIGCLIPNSLYMVDLEENPVESDEIMDILKKVINFDKVNDKILRSLQNLHDSCGVDTWKRGLSKVAKKYKLKTV